MERDRGITSELADYDANGVDRTLVRAMLALTPAERVQRHEEILADVVKLAEAGRTARNGRR